METAAAKYKDRATFVFVYCREAHPEGNRFKVTTKEGKAIPQAPTARERKAMAALFCKDLQLTRRILIDEFGEGSVQRLYGGMPNPTIVIDVDGKIALKMAWTGGEEQDRYLGRFLANGGRYDPDLAKSVKVQGPVMPKDKGKN